ncbi:N-acetylated-alpha-linked acidic dipeptidase [Aaosphaeria arxii CBS 175.79]|uniref:N-acetylated-alpha-linked acidic dipeptidase n=1 Tax=Aaosphaeria arxii CBS 175.79 TaxID=1450172 RepID=A0A6A5XCE6_9PLEO|nr:N-acetylated-alpha-linked acidic dipeptidase [Aaosphaeria arxii CBS 175.79]KAF2010590.1 N-acetylated-alpha-linked acidic dipeptidase [Aaosphaeria arxii CBS 175.79]
MMKRKPTSSFQLTCILVSLAACWTILLYFRGSKASCSSTWLKRKTITFEDLQELIKTTPDSNAARRSTRYYSSGPHLAGTNLSQVLWTKNLWTSWGLESQIVSYDVYLNRPAGHSLTLLQRPEAIADRAEPKVLYEAKLAEDPLEEDPTSSDPLRIPTFHGYSASGNATAQYVYVIYGTYQDFKDLVNANVSLEGKIAIAKYDKTWRGMKVMRAEQLGMVAAVLYTDPGDDCFKESDGLEPYPNGYARQPSSVQRGSVLSINWQPGDPSTPGYPSLPGAPRVKPDGMFGLPKIPSLPISYEDAVPILKALNGHGPSASSFGEKWQTAGLQYKRVKYNIGPSPSEIVLRVNNNQAYEFTTTHNLLDYINGTQSEEVIVHSFSRAVELGWKPRRTLIFARWDSEEYSMTGSTEWVEQHLKWLKDSAVIYINSDPGATGPELFVRSAPLLDHVFLRTAHNVISPNQTIPGQTLGDLWTTGISTLGGGSDYSAFLDHAGVTSADLGFGPRKNAPTYHYHSNYDSITYMEKIIDPDYEYHTVLARMWGLVAAELVEKPVIPFNATHYAIKLVSYVEENKRLYTEKGLALGDGIFDCLNSAAGRFKKVATRFDQDVDVLSRSLSQPKTSWLQYFRFGQRSRLDLKLKVVNTKLRDLEKQFLYDKGLDGRPWFKHTVFAPGFWEGYKGVTLPGLRESITAGDEERIVRWISIVTAAFERASDLLEN